MPTPSTRLILTTAHRWTDGLTVALVDIWKRSEAGEDPESPAMLRSQERAVRAAREAWRAGRWAVELKDGRKGAKK